MEILHGAPLTWKKTKRVFSKQKQSMKIIPMRDMPANWNFDEKVSCTKYA